MEVQQAEGGWHWQTRLETGFCPHHPSLAWLAPSMWFGIVWKQARFLAHISFWGWKEMRHLCGIFWLGRLEGCREVWGTCAIYVGIPSLILANEWDLRHLCPPKAAWCWGKIVGANQRRRLQKTRSFLDIHGANYLFENGVAPSIPCILPLTKMAQLNIQSHMLSI